eukprot:SAG11_NODE_26315_length_346_cov_15.530364_1_plen_33_part_10
MQFGSNDSSQNAPRMTMFDAMLDLKDCVVRTKT